MNWNGIRLRRACVSNNCDGLGFAFISPTGAGFQPSDLLGVATQGYAIFALPAKTAAPWDDGGPLALDGHCEAEQWREVFRLRFLPPKGQHVIARGVAPGYPMLARWAK